MAKQNKIRSLALTLLAIGLVTIGLGVAYRFLTPKLYQATAKVRVDRHGRQQAGARQPSVADLSDLSSEFGYLHSDELFDQVVQNLHLRESWGQHFGKTVLSTNDARFLLRAKARIQTIPGTTVIETQVSSEDPDETAPIANEFARLYVAHRQDQNQSLKQGKVSAISEKLKQQWDEQTVKINEAQARLNTLTDAMNLGRATNAASLYDPAAIREMRAQHIRIESEYVEARRLLDQLKAFTPEQRRLVLPTLVTNALLDKSLEHLRQAQSDLADASAAHAADSAEVKRAAATLNEISNNVTAVTTGILNAREADMAAIKTSLDALTQKIARARTNIDESLTTNNPAYRAALSELHDLIEQRDLLTNDIAADSILAVSPLSLSADLVDSAVVPSKPFAPDETFAYRIIAAGGVVILAGLFLWIVPRPGKNPPPGNREIRREIYPPRRN